jgi:UDP-N-acetylmuramate dehydrogenase
LRNDVLWRCMALPPHIQCDVPLAPLTTLAVGGRARYFWRTADEAALRAALTWGHARGLPVWLLGGGSNTLVADAGWPGLVVQFTADDWRHTCDGDEVRITASAGLVWDDLVAKTCAMGWAGLECLSGIPGWVGAVPVQNVGAYGQEVSDTLVDVRVIDRASLDTTTLPAAVLGLAYRDSLFKTVWRDRYVITAVSLRLRVGDATAPRHPEIAQGLSSLTPAAVRDAVLAVRRRKSMVYDVTDPNHRSAGSFFTNPIVPNALTATLRASLGDEMKMPGYPIRAGMTKLSAAWLIERAGFSAGTVFHGRSVGLSNRHCLALINLGRATAEDLVGSAQHIQARVHAAFGVTLVPEPSIMGCFVAGTCTEALFGIGTDI